MHKIPYSKPWLTSDEERATAHTISSGRLILGPEVRAFETSLATFTGRQRAVAVTSGTTALQLALHALGVNQHYSVLVPAYTWVATWNVVHWLGAEPVMIDVDPSTFCIDPNDFERALASCSRTHRAILPVHMFGFRVDPTWLDAMVHRHNLTLVGDGCCAFGGEHQGLRCGAWTPVECLSFHPRKVITTGEGGAILTDDHELADRLERLRDHGAHRSREQRRQTTQGGLMTPEFPEPGHNFRMTEMQGALGRVQMERVHTLIQARKTVASRYDELIAAQIPWLKLPPGQHDPGRVLTFYPVQLQIPEASPTQILAMKTHLVTFMASHGIAVRTPMIDLVNQPFTRESAKGYDFPGAQHTFLHTLGLPFFPQMTREQSETVVQKLAEFTPTLHALLKSGASS